MRSTKLLAAASLLFVPCASASAAVIAFPTVGVYDAATNANAVDFNASGNPLTSTAGTDVAGFTTSVASGFAANRGGVVDFDSATANTTYSAAADTLALTYGGGKSLLVTMSRDLRTAAYGSATPISGANQLDLPDLQEGNQSFVLTFGAITGGEPNERLTALGFTANSRNVASTVTMTATFSDATTSSLSRALGTTAGTGDTFYGFVAPAGQSITSLTVGRTGRQPFDDLGFVTTVPEPTSAGLAAAAAAGLLARRRRRHRA